MFNCSRNELSPNPLNSIHSYFHRNMKALMQFNCAAMELRDCYKEGMFKFPNSKGFMEVSYFLLKIIYPSTDAFNDCWPVFEKRQEREFRNTVCEMMRGFKGFSNVSAGKLMSPGGDGFTRIMWKLSLLALEVQIKPDSGRPLLHQPNKKSPSNSTDCDYKQLIANNNELKSILSSSKTLLKKSKEIKEELHDNVISLQSEINRSKSELSAVDLYNLNERLKTRLLDPNDTEAVLVLSEMVTQKMKLLEKNREYLKKCGNILKDWNRIAEKVVQQEVNGHEFVLDGRSIGAQSCDGIASSASEVDTEVSLLDHVKESCKNLKTLKMKFPETGSCFYLEEWENVGKEKENVEKDFLKLESELKRIKFVIDASYDKNKLSPEGKLDKSLSIRSKTLTSTPILRRLPESVNTKPANVTPYHEPSVKSIFKSHIGVGNESASFQLETSEITTEIPDSPNMASLEDIIQRFQLIKKKRNEKNNDLGNDPS